MSAADIVRQLAAGAAVAGGFAVLVGLWRAAAPELGRRFRDWQHRRAVATAVREFTRSR